MLACSLQLSLGNNNPHRLLFHTSDYLISFPSHQMERSRTEIDAANDSGAAASSDGEESDTAIEVRIAALF